MAKELTYECTSCGNVRKRDELIAKRIQFREMGMTGKVLETRTVAWLCKVIGKGGKTCLQRDADYGRVAYTEAPGTAAKRGADSA